MRFTVIDEADHPLIASVIELGDFHRQTLGFLPRQVFIERAAAGTIIAAEEPPGTVVGYVLYDLPGNSIRLVHLCVADAARGRGIARQLLAELEGRHPDRVRIHLRCRRDFDAHKMWGRLGFVPVDERPGRSAAGLLLTRWHKTLRETFSLFDLDAASESTKLIVAVDTNVFLDLTEAGRPNREESTVLQEEWVADEVELVHTDELPRELDESEDADRRRRGRSALLNFRRLPVVPGDAEGAWEDLYEALGRPSLVDRYRSDLQHVAHAAVGGADFLVSRDGWLLRVVAPIAERTLAISVRSPAELVLELDRRLRTGAYTPGLLAQTPLTAASLQPGEVEEIARRFVSHAHGERRTSFARRIRSFVADPRGWSTQVIRSEDQAVALIIWAEGPRDDEVSVLRVTPAWPLASTVARQLLYTRRRARARQSGGSVRVTECYLSSPVERALNKEAFRNVADGRVCSVAPLAGSASEVAAMLRQGPVGVADEQRIERSLTMMEQAKLRPEQAADLEAQFWPLKLTDAPLPNYLVPIKPRWAEELFDNRLAEQTLFPRELHLGVAREHVYYRSPRGPRLETPARLIWYVSGQPNRDGVSAVRAVSRLEEVVVDKPARLYERFKHLGIYTLDDVRGAAQEDLAMALRFADTEELEAPVPWERLREHAEAHCHTLVVRSARLIPPGMFADVYREGMNRERRA